MGKNGNVRYLLLILLFAASGLYSQTIINAERVDNDKDSSVFALALNYSGTRGNANTNQLGVAPVVILKKKKNEFKVFGGYNILSSGQSNILNSGYAHARHNYALSKTLKTLVFYQVQFNEVLQLNKREVFGSGLKLVVLGQDSIHLATTFGVMHEFELLDVNRLQTGETAKTNFFRGSFIGSFTWKVNKYLQVTDVLYYQPWLGGLNDYRALNDFNLSIKLAKAFSLLVTSSFRFDSKPPSSLGNYDWNFRIGLNVKL